jgi:hypothetical protein
MNPKPDLPRALVLSILAAAATACGGFADDPAEPNTLATLQGEVRNPGELAVPSNLHVAMIWAGEHYNTAHELPLVPEFPARYELRITELPPTMALGTDEESVGDGSGRWALGTVVGYEDGNGNGEIDLSAGDVPSPDRVVAAHPNKTFVIYLEGSDAVLDALGQSLGTRPDRGFGFLTVKPGEETLVDLQYASIAQPFDLTLTNDPQMSDFLCRTMPDSEASGGTVRSDGGAQGPHPAPGDPNLTCAPDGSSYRYLDCTEYDRGLCQGTHTDCISEVVRRPEPVPSDWPCP